MNSETDELRRAQIMSELLKNVTLKRNGSNETVSADALKNKVVALYFSAHWCPPCRAFTPILKGFYDELKADGELEIVFVSFDKSESELQNYLQEAHGEWLYIPHGDSNIQKLSGQFGVSGIPTLVVVKADGTAITTDGRSQIQTKTPRAILGEWKAKL